MEPRVSFVCPVCTTPFTKEVSEVRRQKKKGREYFFCTRSCSSSNSNRVFNRGKVSNFRGRTKRDDLTSFRWFAARVRNRVNKHGVTDLNPEVLKALWEKQGGVCLFTGWDLLLPDSTSGWESGSDPKNASLDRIDCSKGYVESNVRFVSIMANLARHRFTDDQVREFCKAVAVRG